MGLFKDTDAEKFAEDLATELATRFPPRALSKSSEAKRESVIDRAMNHVTMSARAFRKERKVGVLKQIGVSRKFQQRLDVIGYEEEFIKAATLRLARGLSEK